MSSHYKVLLLIITIYHCALLDTKGRALDSLRVDEIKGEKFIVHRVDPKETLYSISKRYGSSIDEIYQYNPHIESGLKMYDELSIPYNKNKATSPAPTVIVQSTVDAKYSIVKKGQTLFALSRQTGVSVDSLKAINQLSSNTISIGDTIYWAYPNKSVTTTESSKSKISLKTDIKPKVETKPKLVFHTVIAGETLFFISKKYDIKIDELVELNDLDSYVLDVGKELIVSSKTDATTATQTAVVDDTQLTESEIEIAKETALREKRKTDTVFVKTDNNSIRTKMEEENGENVTIQEGFALEINDTDHTTKLLALHKTAPLGSLVSITNQMNGKTIQVRVVGKLLDSPLNKNVVVRLSNSAFESLGALDFKIPITSKYVE